MFKNQPKGLYILSLANTGERFGYFTVISVFLLYLQAKFGFNESWSGQIYAIFMAIVYFTPILGGIVADRWSFSKCVTVGMIIMGIGYQVVAFPTDLRSNFALVTLIAGLALVCIGTGLFKSNLQVMIGDLYNDPKHAGQRDAAFSIYYMAINIGAMFSPAMATFVTNKALSAQGFIYNNQLPSLCNSYLDGNLATASQISEIATGSGMAVGESVEAFCQNYLSALSTGYGYSFAVAFLSIVVSFLIYYLGRGTYQHIITTKKAATKVSATADASADYELTPAQTRERIVALFLVFAVVTFFWMVFMQNGATLTQFAVSCTAPEADSWPRIGFNVWALAAIIVGIYAAFNAFQAKSKASRTISAILVVAACSYLGYIFYTTPDPLPGIQPQDYQQFNGFYIVALTPFSLAFFGWLAKHKKEPSAPRKIGYGMITAALAYVVMIIGSLGIVGTTAAVSSNWLITTYLLLTVAELLLSPMGISFVSKVAPPKYKGMMMGCWFGATAIGNYLVSIPMLLWGKIPVWAVWGILAGLSALSAIVIFAIMKRLEAATADA